MHTADTAAREVLRHFSSLTPELIPVADSVGRVLATAITSPIAIPPWDNSAMDGYALRTADLQHGVLEFPIIEEIPAGSYPTLTVQPGQCSRIFTGAPVPDGADCVIRQEDVTRVGTAIRVDVTRDAGRNVRNAGEDITKGETVFEAGTEISPARLGVLVSLVQDPVSVHRAPHVCVMSSGDEIVDLDRRDEVLAGQKIASSNSYTLISSLRALGARVTNLGIARDDPDDVRERLMKTENADLVVTSAGVSVGEHDYLNAVLQELGVTDFFWRIRMRPGAPVGFGRIGSLGGVPWIGLPGNPVSTMVTFELFVRPAVRRMLGHLEPYRRTTSVRVGERIELGPKLRHFLRVTLTDASDGGPPEAFLTGAQGSGILTSMARADALLIAREDQPVIEKGEIVPALVLRDHRHVNDVPW